MGKNEKKEDKKSDLESDWEKQAMKILEKKQLENKALQKLLDSIKKKKI